MSEKEAQVYLAVLEVWRWWASAIGRRAGLKRATTYSILQDFVMRGIAHKIEQKSEILYYVIDPSELLAKKAQAFQEFEKQFGWLLPEFARIQDPYERKPLVQYYEWPVGLKQFYETLLLSATDIKSFIGSGEIDPWIVDRLDNDYLPRRIAKKLRSHVIISHHAESKRYAWHPHHEKYVEASSYTQTKIVMHHAFSLRNEIDIYDGNKIGFVSFAPQAQYAVVMTSSWFHDSLRSIFDMMWEIAPTQEVNEELI